MSRTPKDRGRTTNRSVSNGKRPARKFLRAMVLSALVSFGVATYALIPQWRDHVPLGQWVSALTSLDVSEFTSLQPVAPATMALDNARTPEGPAAAQAGRHQNATVQTRFSGCQQFFPEGKTPTVPAASLLRELCFSSFAILHSGNTKTPVFVAQRLNRKMLTQAQSVSRTNRFYEEARLPERERARLADYRGSGWSRGHMAPAADMDSPDAMAQSFSLANMVPQDQTQNAGAWSRIEQDTRKYVMRAQGDVFVFTGPVYDMGEKADNSLRTIGDGRVAVPDAIYKLVYDPAIGKSWVHWQANSADSKVGQPISYQEFVSRTGLHLLPEVPVQ